MRILSLLESKQENDVLKKATDSLMITESAVENLMKHANDKITWVELSKFKGSFSAKSTSLVSERVIDLLRMQELN